MLSVRHRGESSSSTVLTIWGKRRKITTPSRYRGREAKKPAQTPESLGDSRLGDDRKWGRDSRLKTELGKKKKTVPNAALFRVLPKVERRKTTATGGGLGVPVHPVTKEQVQASVFSSRIVCGQGEPGDLMKQFRASVGKGIFVESAESPAAR